MGFPTYVPPGIYAGKSKFAIRDACRRFDPSHPSFIKAASIGGEQETGFEQAFSSLAYAYLKDKAPRLLDFLVGFQLVERNEDNTKAMGVFGIKVGDSWLYAPVFFLNGDLKGHELLYIKKQDMFVPMKENWINYVIARKPHLLGERSPQDTFQLGGMSPSIKQMTWPPEQSKFGSDRFQPDVDGWARPFLPVIGAAATKSARFLYREAAKGQKLNLEKTAEDPMRAALAGIGFDLPGLLKESVHLAQGAWNLTRSYPGLKVAFDRFYGPRFFTKVATDIKEAYEGLQRSLIQQPRRQKKAAAKDNGSLIPPAEKKAAGPAPKVIVRDDVATVQNLPELDDKERERLLNDGVLIKDHRDGDEVSVSYNTQVSPQRMVNPHESAIYEVLERPGEFNEMLIISHPYSNRGQKNYVTAVRLGDGNKAWINAHRNNIWTRQVDSRDRYQEWFDGLADNSDSALKKGGMYMAVNERGGGTVPFIVKETWGEGSYKVDFFDNCEYGMDRPGWMPERDDWKSDDPGGYVSSYGAKLCVNAKPDAELRAISGQLHVPDTYKFLQLRKPKQARKDDGKYSLIENEYEPDDKSDPSPISPGDLSDVQLFFMQKTSAMKLRADHNTIWIETEKTGQDRFNELGALRSLIECHGLNEKQARDMIGTARRKGLGGRAVDFRIKYAQPFPYAETAGPGPNAPQFPSPEMGSENHGYRVSPAIYPQEEFMPVEGLQGDLTDPQIYDPFMMPDQNAVAHAQQAGQTGQKELFDVTMMSGMLKSV
ncbi:MAG: hypothetical protein ACYS7M_00450, partial [Planctomycetota bacterium]